MDKEFFSDENWNQFLDAIEKKEQIRDYQKAKALLKELFFEAVKKRAQPGFGVLLSGGVDSSLIALALKKQGYDFCCYCVGTESSPDVESAKKAADILGLRLKTKILTAEEIEEIIKKMVKLLKTDDVVKISVGGVLYAACELAKKDKVAVLFSGLGSEELFAGYLRHRTAKDVNQECWAGLRQLWSRDIERDLAVSKQEKIDFAAPFLDKKLIEFSVQLPAEFKIKKGVNKLIVRELAAGIGLPREFAFRKKSAAQYGSCFDKALQKIARKNQFRFKKKYLCHLLESG